MSAEPLAPNPDSPGGHRSRLSANSDSGEPRTVIDRGMARADMLDVVVALVAQPGHKISDIVQIAVTYRYPVHIGAAAGLCCQSDAAVIAGPADAPHLVGLTSPTQFNAVAASLGVPETRRFALPRFHDAAWSLTCEKDLDRALSRRPRDRLLGRANRRYSQPIRTA